MRCLPWLQLPCLVLNPAGAASCGASLEALEPTSVSPPLCRSIRAALVTPDLRHAGTFQATFLVVAALPHPANNLGFLQRQRWVPGAATLDIG